MVFRKIPVRFGYKHTRKSATKLIIDEPKTTFNDVIYPQLPFMIRQKPYRIKSSNQYRDLAGQQYGYTMSVTKLFSDERVLMNYNKATEIRPHAERLIVEAMRHGDKHRPTMELADYWLRDKRLVHKLFKVFVPRYQDYSTAFTALHMMGPDYSLAGATITDIEANGRHFKQRGQALLEMRGNSLPPIVRPKVHQAGLLTNILIDSARHAKKSVPSEGA